MFNIGFFPRDVSVPESPGPDEIAEAEEVGDGPPSYIPREEDEVEEEGDAASISAGSLLEQLRTSVSLARENFSASQLQMDDVEFSELDLSDEAINAALRDIGLRPTVAAASIPNESDFSFGYENHLSLNQVEPRGSESQGDDDAHTRGEARPVESREPASTSAEHGESDPESRQRHLPFGHDWAKSPALWWDHGWTPRKKYPHEDENSPSWRNHSNHYLVISNAGKPIYSRYGDEHSLAAFGGIVQALVSYVASPLAGGDTIQTVRAGLHEIVFLLCGPLYLVSISRAGTPNLILRHHLSMLHKVFYMLLTSSVEKHFARNPNLDLKPLLQGTEHLFAAVTHSFTWDPSSYLSAFHCLRLHPWLRTTVSGALKAAVLPSAPVAYALVFSGFKVITLAQRKRQQLSPSDLYLFLNLVNSSDSFRRVPETFAPVCLPALNPSAFHYAHVSYLTKEICLALIAPDATAFAKLKAVRESFHSTLTQSGALVELASAAHKEQLPLHEILPYLDPTYSASKAGASSSAPADQPPLHPGSLDSPAGPAAPLPMPFPMGPGTGFALIPMMQERASLGRSRSGGTLGMPGSLDEIETMALRWGGSEGSADSLHQMGEEQRGSAENTSQVNQQDSTSGRLSSALPGSVPHASSQEPLWGPSGLWHFLFKSVPLGQYVTLDFSPLLAEKQRQKRVLRAYQEIYASMHADGLDPAVPAVIKTQSRRDDHMLVLGWCTTEFEFFAVFDAFAETKSAVAICNKICRLLQSLEADIFLLGPVVV